MQEDALGSSVAEIKRLRDACFYVGSPYVQESSCVADLGAASGDAIQPFVKALDEDVYFLVVDRDPVALQSMADRYNTEQRINYCSDDLTQSYPSYVASLTLAVCLLQYLPIKDRLNVLRSAWTNTLPGGALILVEEVQGATQDLHDIYQARNASLVGQRTWEQRNGLPLTARRNEGLLRRAGFATVECFYRSYNYVAWIAIKPEIQRAIA